MLLFICHDEYEQSVQRKQKDKRKIIVQYKKRAGPLMALTVVIVIDRD